MNILQDRKTRIFSSSILRSIGYSLLLIAVVNISFLLIPLQLMNPLWEFQTVGAVVERTPFILLGIVLVCYEQRSDRASIELPILKGLSLFSLISTIVLLLVIPLNINNSFSIYYQNSVINNAQSIAQKDAIEKFEKQLLLADSKEEITAIIQQQTQQINIPASINIQTLKDNILIILQNYRDDINNQIQTFRNQKRLLLIQKYLQWNLGALIAAILFFLIWKSTYWARTKTIPDRD